MNHIEVSPEDSTSWLIAAAKFTQIYDADSRYMISTKRSIDDPENPAVILFQGMIQQ